MGIAASEYHRSGCSSGALVYLYGSVALVCNLPPLILLDLALDLAWMVDGGSRSTWNLESSHSGSNGRHVGER